MSSTILQTSLADFPVRRGKVRDIYDLGDRLLLVSTDRISAFDWVLPTGIPDKGRVLTQLSRFWFDRFDVPHHLLSCDVNDFDLPAGTDLEPLVGRSMLVRKSEVVPIECVVRGYLSGSGWKEYQASGTVCGIKLPAGLRESDQLPEPIFTPATKAEIGEHDENITFEQTCARVGRDLAEELRRRSLDIYKPRRRLRPHPRHHHRRHQIRIRPQCRRRADPHRRSPHARLLPLLARRPVRPRQRPADLRQTIRPRLAHRRAAGTKTARRRNCRAEVVAHTRAKYIDAFERLTAEPFPWK